MGRIRPVLLAAAIAAFGFAAPTAPVEGDLGAVVHLDTAPAGAPLTSDNVVYLGTILTEAPGVGGKVVEVDGQRRFYVTGVKGASVYDVTNPVTPLLMGHLTLPHFQNESVAVSEDGSRMIISSDTAAVSRGSASGNGIRVITVTETVPGRVLDLTETAAIKESNHTAACADAKCEWIYGSSGRVYHAPIEAGGIKFVGPLPTAAKGHAFFRDASGLVISDSGERLVLDPRVDPARPKVITTGKQAFQDGFLQHNNVRPYADQWAPRDADLEADGYPEAAPKSGPLPEGSLRPGELLIGGGESNVNPLCAGSGGITTWDMRDFDKGRAMVPLEFFNPVNGNPFLDGRPAVNALGCSSHWFTVRENMIAASWYEHGVRFFEVGLDTGALEEVGWFQPLATEAGAAHWVGPADIPGLGTVEIVYSVDYARGIDIVGYLPDGEQPSKQELAASWLANLDRAGTGTFANAERYLCRLATTNGGAAPAGTEARAFGL